MVRAAGSARSRAERGARRAVALWKRSRAGRALARYSAQNGGLLAGGIAYTTLFSLTAALTFAWTAFRAALGSHALLRAQVLAVVDQTMPGLLRGSGTGGLVDPDALALRSPWSLTGVVALVIALWTASGIVASVARAVQLMFGVPPPPQALPVQVARNVVGVAVLCTGVLATAVLATLVDLLAPQALRTLGLPEGWGTGLVAAASRVAALCVDALVFVALVRVVAAVRPPRRDLWTGAAIAGVAFGVLRRLGTAVVGSAHGPLLATAATFVTLLLWVNLAARLLLLLAAFVANPPPPAPVRRADDVHARERPNYVTLSTPRTLEWAHHPTTGELTPRPPQKS